MAAFYRGPRHLLVSRHEPLRTDFVLPAGRRARRGGVPLPEIATHAGLFDGWRADWPQCTGAGQERRWRTPLGRVRGGVLDVCHRVGVQPAQTARHAPPRVWPGSVSGGAHHAAQHRCHAGVGLPSAAAVGHELAGGTGLVGRAGHEQHGHCGQAHERAHGDGVTPRQARDGGVAVSGLGRGATVGADSRPGRRWRRLGGHAAGGGPESGGVDHSAASGGAARDALVAHPGGAAQE